VRVDEHTIELAGTPVFYRSAPTAAAGATPLYLHGIPTSADDWTPLLERTGGIAVDLIGFGRSGKGAHLEYGLAAQVGFLERFLAELSVDRLRPVGHDWGGAVALALSGRSPERIERLVVCDPLPLFPGLSFPSLVRRIRTLGLGELIMGSTPRWMFARTLRSGYADPASLSDERLQAIWEQFDQGTQRAVLRTYRSLDEETLAVAGSELERIDAPALVVWGERDPWLAPELADRYGQALPQATVVTAPDAGHWPWFEDPGVLERIAGFVSE
jgi:pimeloyl-ACP methyl ester carboxylesterase